MPTAYSLLPDRFADGRHGTILRGLARRGYRIVHEPGTPRDGRDVLVTWTVHHGAKEDAARAFEAAGEAWRPYRGAAAHLLWGRLGDRRAEAAAAKEASRAS